MEDTEAQTTQDGVDESTRKAFIWKVYSILTFQMGITSTIIAVFTFFEPAKTIMEKYSSELSTASVSSLIMATIFIIVFVRRTEPFVRGLFPVNVILLFIITVFLNTSVGLLVSLYGSQTISLTFLYCELACIAITLFVVLIKMNITPIQAIVGDLIFIFIALGLVTILFPSSRTVYTMFNIVGATIFGILVVVNTKVIITGKFYDPADYVLASLLLYINIFVIPFYLKNLWLIK